MLDELIKTMDYGVSYGSGALKALQNDTLPELDLLVREAIQNSSDASLGIDDERFDVNFNVGKFTPYVLNAELNSLKQVLNERFPNDRADFLEIRDMRTSGLTGRVRLSEIEREDHGNFFKLVFDTGKEQTASSSGEAGGSWGYGKSVYYRVGIGLVLFYSRVFENGTFEERLIFSLIEHETDENSLLKEIKRDSVGRAWWGKKDSKNKKELLPITDEDEIQRLLDIFSLKRFKAKQTGTAIIIPYINQEELLNGIFPVDCGISDDEKAMCNWSKSVKEYLELAIEKWYAPKVFNKHLREFSEQKWLAVKVNGESIKFDTMRPLFQLVQELYTTALAANTGKSYQSEEFDGIECVEVPSRKVEGNQSGHVAYIRVKQSCLAASGSMIKPYTYLRLFEARTRNEPIVMFARTPGLVLDYKVDGKWAKGLIMPEDDEEFILAFYVPNCELKLKHDIDLGEFSGKSFGEYLRKCEKSDHMDWDDKSNLTIVSNLKSQLIAKINSRLKEENEVLVAATTSRLSGKLGKCLLPQRGYGKTTGGGGSGSGGSGGGGKADNLEFVLSPRIKADCMEIDFVLKFKNLRKSAAFGIFIETETGVMDADAWESNINDTFPVIIDCIDSVSTHSLNTDKELRITVDCTQMNPEVNNDYSCVKLLRSKSRKNIAGFSVHNEITNAEVRGKMTIRTIDRKYVCTVKEIKNA